VDGCAPSSAAVEVVALDAAPDLVVVFGSAPLADLPAPAVVWQLPGGAARPDDLRPEDRVVACEPGVADAWRVMPPPVADRLFSPADGAPIPGRALWLTPDGPRRRDYLERFDHSAALVEAPAQASVAINLHDGERMAFQPRAARALAAGQLLVSETLEPSFGLEPGIDYLEARDMTDLFITVENAAGLPDAYASVRIRGRRKAEWFRSSLVVARLRHDLEAELASARTGARR
jgi:hypothetical protein